MCKGSYHVWDWTGIRISEEKELSPEYFNLSEYTGSEARFKPGSPASELSSQHSMGLTEYCIQFHVKPARRKKLQYEPQKQMKKKKADLKTRKEKISNEAKQLFCK